ncbi:hypothetical protein C8E03_110134 [Lachnotalea glycerini]|uniref:Uncharacterized protein n=1 Tax=Lachnotalea glycerini TaxID=1763509 RepID=A0A318EP17_9FIRM|nr:CD1375 family protein [Lachnotalea glycerini]PXV87373.1 hypothetical protein C8E03_110134 [Lachnotalea glycerini]
MEYIYAFLIIKGEKTMTQVPDKLQSSVKLALESLDCGNLAIEDS